MLFKRLQTFYKKAVTWLEKVAAHGNSIANSQYCLGGCYQRLFDYLSLRKINQLTLKREK